MFRDRQKENSLRSEKVNHDTKIQLNGLRYNLGFTHLKIGDLEFEQPNCCCYDPQNICGEN